ncbi:raffinose invertase-like [Maniola hyperantus]|uniref:raffinose invertase-like n=1 Tax=Aphantopus hyperantus TaxID=2795564 RepID=UPI001567D43B|nr:raffinose invertase-like [Maniola hyperantus]
MRQALTLMDVFKLISWFCALVASVNSDSSPVDTYLRQKKSFLKKKYRPIYHLTALDGWMTNPAGITLYRGQYHMFYQYHPYNGAWGHMSWGHAVSTNLIDWVHYPSALMPSDYYDRHGCLAGSALVNRNFLTLFYTGHVISDNVTFQTQNIAMSGDGVIFKKFVFNPIIRGSPIRTGDIRNPKVWRFQNHWYMILGTTSRQGNGELLLYTSPDMFSWTLNGSLVKSYGDMGYIWESPDLFQLDGLHVLLLSVQGIEVDGFRFNNLYQTGYVLGRFNYFNGRFDDLEVSVATFNQLDYGHDFYAAKTFFADGRRILIAWMGMWENDFIESTLGWAGMTTAPRELRLNQLGRLLMTPIKEMMDLRVEMLENAWYVPGEAFQAGSKSFELLVNSTTPFSDMALIFEWRSGGFSIAYSADQGYISIDRGGTDGVRQAYWSPEEQLYLRILVDFSSIEIFCGDGEVVFTSRIYPKSMKIRIGGNSNLYIIQYRLRASVGFDDSLTNRLKKT